MKKQKISTLGNKLMDSLVNKLDSKILYQPICNLAEYGNPRLKVSMLNKLTKTSIVSDLYKQKPKLVNK